MGSVLEHVFRDEDDDAAGGGDLKEARAEKREDDAADERERARYGRVMTASVTYGT